jgi:hypothetical protein
MSGEAATGRASVPEGDREFDPREMLQATLEALGSMDVVALETLSARATAMAGARVRLKQADAREAVALKNTLAGLLQSTERSLRMLRGLQETRVRKLEEETWER